MARALIVLAVAILAGLCVASPCHECGRKALAGCVAFGESPHNQCLDLMCPEVHVGSCTNPCSMTTQTYSVPKSMCSAPYCSLPAPQPAPPLSRPVFPQQAICAHPTCCMPQSQPLRCQKPPPPRTMQQQFQGYCMPYSYPPQMPAAPSYCVQSVVVGGKAEQKDEEKPSGHDKPSDPVGPPGGRTSDPSDPRAGLAGARDPLLGGALDPQRVLGGTGAESRLAGGGGLAVAGGGGLLGSRVGDPYSRQQVGQSRPREDDTKRYETYLEKILDVIKDKMEPDCNDPSPIMVVHQPQPRMRVRKIRRRKQRKYMIESCSDDPDEVVEEEEETSPYIFTAPVCRSSCSCRRCHRSYY